MPELPDDLVIPHPFVGKRPDFGSWQPARIYVPINKSEFGRRRFPTVEIPAERRVVSTFQDLLSLLGENRHTFTISHPGDFDALFKSFRREELFRLQYGLPAFRKDYEIRYRGSSISIKQGKQRWYLWNLWHFFSHKESQRPPESLYIVESLVTLLFAYFEKCDIPFDNLSSPSAVSRHLMLRYGFREFASRDMHRENLADYYRACHGARQESVGLGTVDSHNYDMRNAHLNILASLPSLRGCQYRKDWPYIEDASYGVYCITAKIPRMPLCPLPVEIQSSFGLDIIYPHGEISGWYAKPFIDLLKRLKIDFTVHASHQYVPAGDIDFPFKEATRKVREFIRTAPEVISSKALYWGMAGSTISWRWVANEETGDLFPRAFNVFSPLIYSHVLAKQSTRVFVESQRGGPLAIRSDAITTREKVKTVMRLEDEGPVTFVTPLLKTFPSGRGERWHDLLKSFRDRDYIEYYPDTGTPTIRQYLMGGKPLGTYDNAPIRVHPNHGQRIGPTPRKVGQLLDSFVPSVPPSMEHVQRMLADDDKSIKKWSRASQSENFLSELEL